MNISELETFLMLVKSQEEDIQIFESHFQFC